MKQAKVSIICSVYNNEKYIHKCINSILKQTLQDIEIILIDNGCTDNCPQIIDAYSAKDKRIISWHNIQGTTFGTALNQGIKIASGEYIGIVESDDFIDEEMYEELYNKAKKFNVDICLSDFYIHEDKKPKSRIFGETIRNSFDDKVFTIDDFPFLLTCHQSMWSKLYKANFIKQIKFMNQSKYIDAPFMIYALCAAKRMIAIHKAFYNYRIDNPEASNSNKRNDISLIGILNCWQVAKETLQNFNLYDKYKEEFYFAAAKPSIRFYKNIDRKYKKKFFNAFKKFLNELKQDRCFSYKYFEDDRKQFFLHVLSNNYKATVYENYKLKKLLFFPIYEKMDNTTSFLCGIIKIEEKANTKYFKLLNIKIKTKYIKSENNELSNIKLCLDNINSNINRISRQILALRSFNQAIQIHKTTFLKYANIFNGKDIVVCGCGPSSKYYKPIDRAIHIGINRAFKNKNVKFDFMFVQDSFPEGMDDINNYLKETCTKFYGVLPYWRQKEVSKTISPISETDIIAAKANKYIIDDQVKGPFALDLSIEPIADYMGCVFSALQFALYTNPKNIYLVGFDANISAHFYNDKVENFCYQIASWKEFKEVAAKHYPKTNIISINPVGLRGLFRDVYQNSKGDQNV